MIKIQIDFIKSLVSMVETFIGTLNHNSLAKVEKRTPNFWTKFENSNNSGARAHLKPELRICDARAPQKLVKSLHVSLRATVQYSFAGA